MTVPGIGGEDSKPPSAPKKVIIDTDPGIDDAMAIFFALKSPELDVIGLTTIFGNVQTVTATVNALHLLEFAGREDIPVSEGYRTSLRGAVKERIADFVHGSDGLGNTYPTLSDRKPIDTFAPDFLIQKVNEFPGEVTIVALGPLTNLAKAVEQDPTFAKKVGQIIILGGAFQVNGNVNPAAEANIYGDPEAADIVFTCGADILVVGINITHQVYWTGQDLRDLGESSSKFGKYLYAASHFYAKYHREAYDIDAIYLHDPATMVAAVDPSLMTFSEGAIRVQQEGICRGLTLFNNSNKVWHDPTDWCGIPPVKVAVAVDNTRVASLLKERLTAPSYVPGDFSSDDRQGQRKQSLTSDSWSSPCTAALLKSLPDPKSTRLLFAFPFPHCLWSSYRTFATYLHFVTDKFLVLACGDRIVSCCVQTFVVAQTGRARTEEARERQARQGFFELENRKGDRAGADCI